MAMKTLPVFNVPSVDIQSWS